MRGHEAMMASDLPGIRPVMALTSRLDRTQAVWYI